MLIMMSWFSRKYTFVTPSTVEAEYIATSATSQEAIWLQKLHARLFDQLLETTLIYCDNKSCFKPLENPVFMTSRSTLRSNIISSKTWCWREQWSFNTYPQTNKLWTFSPNLCLEWSLYSSETSLAWCRMSPSQRGTIDVSAGLGKHSPTGSCWFD